MTKLCPECGATVRTFPSYERQNRQRTCGMACRQTRGERNANAKLTLDQVVFLRTEYAPLPRRKKWGIGTQIAEAFGVSRSQISRIAHGHAW